MLLGSEKFVEKQKLLARLHQCKFDQQQQRGNFDGAKVQQKVKWALR